jgi:hypothetical protein
VGRDIQIGLFYGKMKQLLIAWGCCSDLSSGLRVGFVSLAPDLAAFVGAEATVLQPGSCALMWPLYWADAAAPDEFEIQV